MDAVAIPVPDYVAFDVETTGFSPDEDRIIEVAFVRFENGVPVKRWSSLVHPGREVGLKIIRLTGIDRDRLAMSPDFASICGEIEEFRGRLPLVGHNPDFDVAFLSKVIQGFPGVPVYDTLELARIVCPGLKSYKLGDLAAELGVALCDAHRACDDAEATGMIFELIQRRIIRLPEDLRRKIVSMMGEGWVSARLFDVRESPGQQLRLFIHALPRPMPACEIAPRPADLEEGEEGLGSGEKGANREDRPDRGERVPIDWLPGLLEAGSGPAFVDFPVEWLTPGSLAASLGSYSGQAVLAQDVATLPMADADVCFLSLPQDYLCLLKAVALEKFAGGGLLEHLDEESRRFLSTIAVWRTQTRHGVFRELQLAGKGHALSRELSCSDFPHCREQCPCVDRCYYLKALTAASGCRVIVTPKQSLLDISRSISASACIVVGLDDLGDMWERRQPRLNLGRLKEALEALDCRRCAGLVDRVIYKSLGALGSSPDMVVPDEIMEALGAVGREIRLVIPDLRQGLRDAIDPVRELPFDPPVLGMNLGRLEYWTEQMEGVLAEDGSSIRLLERGYGDSRGVIARRTVWPAIEAKHELGRRFETVVLVSAYASFVSGFQGLRRMYGMEPGGLVRHAGTGEPKTAGASGENRGALLISVDKGQKMSHSEHLESVGEFLRQLALESNDNILCLCPSYSYIRQLNACISAFLESQGIAVFAQGVDGGPRVLEHLAEPDTVVLARFGVDIEANSQIMPRILVIPKVPFLPPNTIADLRQREISSLGMDGFIELSVLPVAFALRTYMESLSRVAGKIGVFLLDPKLLPGQSAWGKHFMAQFADMNTILCPPQMAIAQGVKWVCFG